VWRGGAAGDTANPTAMPEQPSVSALPPWRECLSCGVFTRAPACEACGGTELGPPRARFGSARLRNTPPARFPAGQTRTGRPD